MLINFTFLQIFKYLYSIQLLICMIINTIYDDDNLICKNFNIFFSTLSTTHNYLHRIFLNKINNKIIEVSEVNKSVNI